MNRFGDRISCLVLTILCQFVIGTAFLTPTSCRAVASSPSRQDMKNVPTPLASSSSSSSSSSCSDFTPDVDKNTVYVRGLMENLSTLCDKYIVTGSEPTRKRLLNVLDRIYAESFDRDLVLQSVRMAKRAAVPFNDEKYLRERNTRSNEYIMEQKSWKKTDKELGRNDAEERRQEAASRKEWESQRTSQVGDSVADNLQGRSALSRRDNGSQKPDLFMSNVMNPTPETINTMAQEKKELHDEMEGTNGSSEPQEGQSLSVEPAVYESAANRVSELIAKAGGGSQFEGETLGIGGLDDVLAQVKRRVWIPLAAPPSLLQDLGIHPVRGLLLYGRPGCGKTLLARTLGNILSPMRPITVVSGPEILDKFVGSSEKNLREIFDNPPDIYDNYRIGEADGGQAISSAALHVVVMDEFDAVARTRGGKGGKGDQGDAGVARDSVVNQLLAKMDGVHPLPVPTLVIGLTNKRSLVDTALLRPGRFEVQVEVPPPKTVEARVSILKVHTQNMNRAGRLLVRDPPKGTAAEKYYHEHTSSYILSYDELLEDIAQQCEGYSGAALAGVTRAAASHALERAVGEISLNGDSSAGNSMMDCLVTPADFKEAVADVKTSMGTSDFSEESEEQGEEEKPNGEEKTE
ncbi:unnamed protein product [Cylindrotheca closterium]|uniref:Vesicle-fusing ATPase n=1 Tax=Cylindrotheca closterium TaxID=2856 RepID=A0AAD2CP69_9STRA|nr:unnamed protein product [Cylindrotheca closterium]